MPFGSSQWMYSSGFYPTEIDQSLMFDGSSYLSRTPSVAGNRKTWTFSTWVKLGKIGTASTLFSAGADGSNRTEFDFRADGRFQLYSNTSGVVVGSIVWSPNVYRDPSAWYHLSLVCDTTNATNTNRFRFYVNGVQVTGISGTGGENTWPSQNADLHISNNVAHSTGRLQHSAADYFYGYLADTYFVDGQALDATSFGEFKSGVWIPKAYTGSYGTNGFHLTYQDDPVSEGFNTVTWNGNSVANTKISGVGFSPDLIWMKHRSGANVHQLTDSVRGALKALSSDSTAAENTYDSVRAFDTDGFTMGTSAATNSSGQTYVGWCWDAGDSTVSNTDGSITSSVRANPAYGFSVVSYTGTGANATVGHGLGAAPSMIIVKRRTGSACNWPVWHSAFAATNFIILNSSNAKYTTPTTIFPSAPTSTVFNIGTDTDVSGTSDSHIAYCFSEIAGYSKFGSYTGTGASGNVVTTGFKPAFVMIKRTDGAGDWFMFDSTRDVTVAKSKWLRANYSGAEVDNSAHAVTFTATGFQLIGTDAGVNGSGGTYIYMAFADTRDLAFWRDQSGNGNDWQPTNLNYQDTVFDSPTNNFATLNPTIRQYSAVDFTSEGNLKYQVGANGGATDVIFATIPMTSGKWFAEVQIVTTATGQWIGVCSNVTAAGLGLYAAGVRNPGYAYRVSTGNKCNNDNTGTAYGASSTTGDIIGIAMDADAGSITFYKNGVSLGVAYTGMTNTGGGWLFGADSDPNGSFRFNFGQSGFTYTPPTDFLALCTANLPEPSISPANGASPQDHFNTVTYTGDGTTSHAITNVGFQPDLVWVKGRNEAYYHRLTSIGLTQPNYLATNATDAESSGNNTISSLDSNGFTVDATGTGGTNESAINYVGWNWKASNATAVSNTAGTITSQVSANPTAGFSIVSYTGTGTTGSTIGHGLSQTPELQIIARRDSTNYWMVTHKDVAAGSIMHLYSTIAAYGTSNAVTLGATVWTESGSGGYSNVNGGTYLAYNFHSVEGYSKFGSYTGNGSTDGPFVYTGFRPAWLMFKRTDGVSTWEVVDTTRSTYNVMAGVLQPNNSSSELSGGDYGQLCDATANGFKIRSTSSASNTGTVIYMAFAENPFKYANAR